jgi:hypothetical protein
MKENSLYRILYLRYRLFLCFLSHTSGADISAVSPAYSLTAPVVMPPTIYFCPSRYTMMTGIQVRMISAKM